jgi:hypothetical protein
LQRLRSRDGHHADGANAKLTSFLSGALLCIVDLFAWLLPVIVIALDQHDIDHAAWQDG